MCAAGFPHRFTLAIDETAWWWWWFVPIYGTYHIWGESVAGAILQVL